MSSNDNFVGIEKSTIDEWGFCCVFFQKKKKKKKKKKHNSAVSNLLSNE